MLTVPKELLKALTTVSTPLPWRKQSFAVGGLWTVGFGSGSDLLLVVSASGRGVFDCLSGERVARDSSDDDTYDEDSETTAGIGPLAGSRVEMNGAGGGIVTRRRLPLTSHDGWVVANTLPPASSNEAVLLCAPTASGDAAWSKIADAEEVRAIGFSPTNRTLVVAEPHTLHVWCR